MSAGEEDYQVGYRRPPKGTRFKKGQSGNKKGRSKESRNFSTDLDEVLQAPVTVMVNGRPKKVTTQLAVLYRLREKALKGEQRANERFLDKAEQRSAEKVARSEERALTATEEDILAHFGQQLLAEAGVEPAAANPDEGMWFLDIRCVMNKLAQCGTIPTFAAVLPRSGCGTSRQRVTEGMAGNRYLPQSLKQDQIGRSTFL